MIEEQRLIFKHLDKPGYSNDINCYIEHGGYTEPHKLRPDEPPPAQIVSVDALRLVQGRPWHHRVAGRSLLIGDVPWVAQVAWRSMGCRAHRKATRRPRAVGARRRSTTCGWWANPRLRRVR